MLPVLLRFYRWGLDQECVATHEGIKICASEDVPSQQRDWFAGRTIEAIDLIKRGDPRRFRRVQRFISYIINTDLPGAGAYVPDAGVCYVNFAIYPSETRCLLDLIDYAATLVHESTHGAVEARGIRFNKHSRLRIERLCYQEEQRFVERNGKWAADHLATHVKPQDPRAAAGPFLLQVREKLTLWFPVTREQRAIRRHALGRSLIGARLCGATLAGAKLDGAVLRNARLVRGDLQGADLREADLSGADLERANLSRAHLGRANLSDANLREANLTDAHLGRASLEGAKLLGADLRSSYLSFARLDEAIYDQYTQWPSGFDPQALGARLLE